MKIIANTIAILLTAAALSPLGASAHDKGEYVKDPLGYPAATAAATRTIDVTANTRSVNVDQGDIVTFNVEGKTFAWQFDTLRDGRIDFAAIAPSGIQARGIQIYVAPNPIYRN